MLYEKFKVSTLSRVKIIKLLCSYHESIRNSVIVGVIFSETSSFEFSALEGHKAAKNKFICASRPLYVPLQLTPYITPAGYD